MACGSCGSANRPGALFCDACGAPLASFDAGAAGERRQLTAMFCDLVGSTPLARKLDPEDFGELVRGFQAMATEPIERFGGRIAQHLGDGLLAYFGHPRAHEDDPTRALHAALAILEGLPALNRSLRSLLPEPVRLRIALHTGLVVVTQVGAGDHLETLALGDTVHVADRLLAVAEPDWIVASDDTWRLAAPGFPSESLGPQHLRGVAEPVRAYRVLSGRAEAVARRTLSPLVGRDREVERLLAAWAQVRAGRGRTVLVEGEAGIGKTRLVASLRDALSGAAADWLEWRASRYHAGTAFHPVIVALERHFGLVRDEGSEVTAAKLERALAPGGEAPPAEVARLGDLLSRPLPPRYARPAESAESRRRATLDGLCTWIHRLATRRPLVLAVEDLHWADPSTLELLGRLVATRIPLLLLFTFRPSFAPPATWTGDPVERIALEPLTRWQSSTLVESLTAGRVLPASVRQQLVERTDGVPLFVEELTHAVLESEALRNGAVGMLEIPSTLQGSLMARLDNLGPAKKVAQVASVLGREFDLDLLAAVGPHSFELALPELVASGLVHLLEGTEGRSFAFKHGLVQEAAYQSQLRAERRAAHARVARVLETRFPERVEAEPETIARHCEGAGLVEDAARHLKRAGELAIRRSAHTEAMGHLDRALALLRGLPEGAKRSRLELGLLVALGSPIAALRGYGHPDVERTQQRARELAREVGPGPELYQAIGGLYFYHGSRAELEIAADLAEQLVTLGERADDRFVRCMGEGFWGLTLHYQGRFREGWAHYERMFALDPVGVTVPPWYVHDPEPTAVAGTGAMTLAVLGDRARAEAVADEAIEHGRKSENPFNLAYALAFGALALLCCDRVERVLALAEEGVALSAHQGFPIFQGLATVLRGWALAHRGEAAKGVEEIRRGLALGSQTRALVEGPRVLALLAEAQRWAGDPAGALASAEGGLRLAQRQNHAFWNPELERIAAELRLDAGPEGHGAARAGLRRALDQADAAGAVLFDARLRATLASYRIESV